MRRYAFLQCIGCRHFKNKGLFSQPGQSGPAFTTAAYVGICKAPERPEWIVWQSLEWSVDHMGQCPDREPLANPHPDCPLYDFTSDSLSEPYPKTCVYHDTSACPRRHESTRE